MRRDTVQIKICGLQREEAIRIVSAGNSPAAEAYEKGKNKECV